MWSGGFGFGVDDDGLAVADSDGLAGGGLELGGEVAGAAFLVDARVVLVDRNNQDLWIGVPR